MPDVYLPCQVNRWRFGELACDTFAVFLAFSQTESRLVRDVLNEEQLSAALHSFGARAFPEHVLGCPMVCPSRVQLRSTSGFM